MSTVYQIILDKQMKDSEEAHNAIIEQQQTINKNVGLFENAFLAYTSTKLFNKTSERERNVLNGLFFHVRKVLRYETTMSEYVIKTIARSWLNIIFNGYHQSKFYKDISYQEKVEIEQLFEMLKENC